jgi:hypothetical protein
MEQVLEFDNPFQQYVKPSVVKSDCSDIIFINNGTEDVIINGVFTLAPNQSWSSANFRIDIDRTDYKIEFGNGGGTQNLVVIRKLYRHINYRKR